MLYKSKKILFITNLPAPYRIDFCNELGKQCDLTVIFEAKREHGITLNWDQNKITSFKAIFLKDGEIQDRKINWSIMKYLDSSNFDSIVLTNYTRFTQILVLLYFKIRNIPYFYEVDGAMIKPYEGFIKRLIKSFFLSGAKAYFSPSKGSDDYFHYYTKSNRIHRYPFTSIRSQDILDNPIIRTEKQLIKDQLGIKHDFIILAVGRFIRIKGFDILMKAAQQLNKNIGIYIVGGEPTKEYLELQQEFDLKQVHFEGFKTKDELAEYFKATDLFVLPTRGDSWGLVINEAMAYGLPVITTNKCVAGLELLSDEKCIVDVDDVDGLYTAIMRVFNNRSLQEKLALENLKKIRNYTIEKMAQAHLEIINR